MSLEAGHKLAHYEILEPIGKGGMGEVYRAKDSKLGRDVAIKVLPDEFARDEERLRRFQREAKVLASLNHPNIAAIYGLEHSGENHYLVLELVPGETLADRIARGPIPVEEALEIARKITEALEEAHEQGIVHRDLKPANVKLTPDDKVKVLDFGLAKAFAEEGAEGDAATSMSPTITRDATRVGVILGTAAYMSPEQAKGKAVDKRTDIFSFGIVLYEMLTGKRAFAGEDISDILARILASEPDWTAIPSDVDPRVQNLLHRCLTKDQKNRLRDIGEARFQIEEILTKPSPAAPRALSTPTRTREMLAWGLAILVASFAVWTVMRPEPPAPAIVRFPLSLPPDSAFTNVGRHVVALSPDGTRLVYVANQQLYLREMEKLEAVPIRGTEMTPLSPFFSPDGQWVGFYARRNLRKISVTGGAPVTLCEAIGPYGASWGPDNTILFGQPQGILRVSANGGIPEVIIPMDPDRNERAHGPQMLLDGKTVLFTLTTGSWGESQIVTQSLDSGERRVVIEAGADARYVPTGHLVYALGSTLLAVPFDLDSLEVTGGPVPVVEGVVRSPSSTATAQVSFSESGTLVYVAELSDEVPARLVWVDRDGREEVLAAEPRTYTYPRISPDGSQIALDVRDQERDIWIWDFTRETLRRLTFHAGNDNYPVWTPDGRRVAFSSDRGRPDTFSLFWKAADGTGPVEQLTEGEEYGHFSYVFSPGGKQLVYQERNGSNLGMHLMDGDGSSGPLLVSEFLDRNAEISPDGRWLAYESNASGQFEIYVRPFPNVEEGLQQVSRGGGTRPVWARNGRELFYMDLDYRVTSVSVRTNSPLEFGNPEVVVAESYPPLPGPGVGRHYDVSPDGERFLMIKEDRGAGEAFRPELVLVLNWFDELERLVPTN